MPRIPESLIESIKRDVSCVGVLEARGLEFRPHGGGGDVVCRCPFHDDHTPSLVVSPSKNLWRCHGACGIGGDVIALVQKLQGVSFRHAVELAASGVPALAASFAAEAADTRRPPKASSARLLPCPLESSADDARLMQQVVDYYAGRLAVPGNAGRAYLASRGLDDAELMRRFALGFSDRSLGLRLPNKQRKEGAELRSRLERLGLFRASGHEHFAGSVVVPIHGDEGTVVGMYGRKVTMGLRNGTPLHTYLPGKHRGIWNGGPDLVDAASGAVVVCEALIDAMSFWVAGVRNVTAAYGVSGWTEDHERALVTGKAREAFIAYDADAAGDAAAAKLAEMLIGRGFTAFRVVFPPGSDANEVLTAKDGGREALAATVPAAQWLGGTPRVTVPRTVPAAGPAPAAKEEAAGADGCGTAGDPDRRHPAAVAPDADAPAASFAAVAAVGPSSDVVLKEEGEEVWATLGTRQWRVRGLERNRGGEVLKVTIRVAVAIAGAERMHIDALDLYQCRQRQAFIAAASEETGLQVEVLKSDLGRMLLALECLQAERGRKAALVTAAAAGATRPEMTAQERDKAMEFLRCGDLAERIVNDLNRCGLVGEGANKLVAYLAATSRLLDQPLAVLVQSSSAAGKSTLMDRVLALMPPEAVRQYSAISGKSPFYLGTANLKHRILAIAEEEGARRASYALKLLQSEGFLSMAATGKDPDTGKLVTHDYRVEGPVMLMLTTTAIDVDPELMNRCLVLTVDEEQAQTVAIQQAQRQARTLEGMEARRDRAAIEEVHRAAQRLLRGLTVVNPHAPALSFAAGQTRLRRDHAKYLALIDTVALLHQYQREVKHHVFPDGTAIDYIEVTKADIALANRLATVVLERSLDDLPPQTRRCLTHLHAWAAQAAGAADMAVADFTFTRRQAREALGIGQTQMALHLERLTVHECVTALRPVGDGLIRRYRLAWEPGEAGSGQAAPVPQGPIGTTATCRDSAPPVGGLSEVAPTGGEPLYANGLSLKTGTCRTSRTHIAGAGGMAGAASCAPMDEDAFAGIDATVLAG